MYFRVFIISKYFIAVSTLCSSAGDRGRSRCGCFSLLEEARMLFLLLLPFSSGVILLPFSSGMILLPFSFSYHFVATFFRLPFFAPFSSGVILLPLSFGFIMLPFSLGYQFVATLLRSTLIFWTHDTFINKGKGTASKVCVL